MLHDDRYAFSTLTIVEETEAMIAKHNFRRYILDALELFSRHLHSESYSIEDRDRLLRGFVCFLRLLCIITYDVGACRVLTECDYESFLNVSKSIKRAGEDISELKQNSYFTNSLNILWNDEAQNPIVSYLMSHIFRNFSCCGTSVLFL